MKIPLTAGQAVTIHGWLNPKEILSWTDVIGDSKLSFSFLCFQIRISKELLYRLQPDITAWVKSGKITLYDTPHLNLWGAHPIRDLKADLGDIVNLRWTAEVMSKAGVTYSDLLEAGMTSESMGLFNYTLYDWSTLEFTKAEAEKITETSLIRLFGMRKEDVKRCLK